MTEVLPIPASGANDNNGNSTESVKIDRSPQLAPYRFTKQNAKEASAKGHAARLRSKLAAIEGRPPETADQPDPNSELGLVWAECNRISSILAGKVAVKDRLELGGLLDKLLDRMRIIRGQALPGTASSRAPAPAPSPVSRLLEAGSAPMIAPAARPARDEQE